MFFLKLAVKKVTTCHYVDVLDVQIIPKQTPEKKKNSFTVKRRYEVVFLCSLVNFGVWSGLFLPIMSVSVGVCVNCLYQVRRSVTLREPTSSFIGSLKGLEINFTQANISCHFLGFVLEESWVCMASSRPFCCRFVNEHEVDVWQSVMF